MPARAPRLRGVIWVERLGCAAVVGGWLAFAGLFIAVVALTIDRFDGEPMLSLMMVIVASLIFGPPITWIVYRYGTHSFLRPLLRELERHGPPRDVVRRIDAEVVADDDAEYWGQPHDVIIGQPDLTLLTRNWFVRLRPGDAIVLHLPDLVWVHLRVGFAKWQARTGYRFLLGLWTRGGRMVILDLFDRIELTRLLRELLHRRPALLVGWQGDLPELRDRDPEAIARAYGQREKEFANIDRAERAEWLDEAEDLFHRFVMHIE